MYDVPVSEAFTLMRLQDERAKASQDESVRSAGGGLRGFHERMKKRRAAKGR